MFTLAFIGGLDMQCWIARLCMGVPEMHMDTSRAGGESALQYNSS